MGEGMDSRPVSSRQIYRQDTAPADERLGIIWSDTSGEGVTTRIWDGDTWASIVPNFPVFVTQEAVSFAETEVSVIGGQIESGSVKPGLGTHSQDLNSTSTDDNGVGGMRFTAEASISEIDATVDTGNSGISTYDKVAITEDWSVGPDLQSFSNVNDGETVTFDVVLEPGTQYLIYGKSPTTDLGYYDGGSMSTSLTSGEVGYRPYWGESSDSLFVFSDLTFRADTAAVEFNPVPEDLAAWDRASWQADDGDGSVTATVETNDGTGWTVFAADVAAPYSIASVPVDNDVRVRFDFSTPETGTDPLVSYVARRGER
jgi:hypothetical protein